MILEFKRPKKPPVVPSPVKQVYMCLRCKSESFTLFDDGTIHCAKCKSLISNLCVSFIPPKAKA
jgi:hypothetical protein